MATWQYNLRFIPEELYSTFSDIVPVFVNREWLDEINWRMDKAQRIDLERQLSQILERNLSPNPQGASWGVSDGNEIRLWSDGGLIEISARIDVRDISTLFIKEICSLARQFNWMCVTENGEVIQPSERKILSIIYKSDAFRFVSDPESFFDKIKRDNINPADD